MSISQDHRWGHRTICSKSYAKRPEAGRRIFEEAASGGRWDRPELHRVLDHLREGDTLVVWKLDHLSRSLTDVLAYHGADHGSRCRRPFTCREYRHHVADRSHDDADVGCLC